MGFGLGFIFVLLPLTVLLLILWVETGKRLLGIALGLMWLGAGGIFLLAVVSESMSKLDPDDFYGEYVIDRTKFPGRQADWQYNHYRFEITPANELRFHVTDGRRIVRTYAVPITFTNLRATPHLVLQLDSSRYHILADNPTLYRTNGEFYYVFESPHFGNVFFTKGHWQPIGD